ncbi:MAG: general secretion pathway protein, partial [Pirellulales bacterium]|nr:general secretion pathway protein [Pirellulales bacterium]
FTLVRSGKLISVINLGDPRSVQQLDAIADLVTVAQLDQRSRHDVVKCIFPLGKLQADDAVEELSALNLMSTPAVFAKTNQLMITDTVAKLKSVKSILDAFQPALLDNGTVVKSFALKHVEAEDVLLVARPHLGLATGEMIGIDVSLSSDLQGKNIYVTGVEDKVKLIEGLIAAIDQPKADLSEIDGQMVLRSHLVEGGNVKMVYDVLVTLLAGKTARLSMDETASSVVALASEEVQSEIEQTVQQLQAADADFEVIPLKNVDPYLAISLLEELLDLPDAFDDPKNIDPDAPKIDADPENMRLFVRAKRHQIEQIKKIVAGLDVSSGAGSDAKIRILSLQGEEAERMVETAAKFWRGANPIILYKSEASSAPKPTERVVNDKPLSEGQQTLTANQVEDWDLPEQRLLTVNADSRAEAIRCQVMSRGLLLQSEDTAALDQFEEHLRMIAGPVDTTPSPPIVFYLRYTKPDDAL